MCARQTQINKLELSICFRSCLSSRNLRKCRQSISISRIWKQSYTHKTFCFCYWSVSLWKKTIIAAKKTLVCFIELLGGNSIFTYCAYGRVMARSSYELKYNNTGDSSTNTITIDMDWASASVQLCQFTSINLRDVSVLSMLCVTYLQVTILQVFTIVITTALRHLHFY